MIKFFKEYLRIKKLKGKCFCCRHYNPIPSMNKCNYDNCSKFNNFHYWKYDREQERVYPYVLKAYYREKGITC